MKVFDKKYHKKLMENTYNYLIEDKIHAMTTENQPQIAGWCSILPLIAGLR